MRDSQLEELISAYLDGEVSSDERELVERHLAESAESRQLFEQLERQQRLLRSLPRRFATPDLSAQVVARLGKIEHENAVPPPAAQRTEHSGHWKLVLGVATALAAGLLIALMIRGGNKRNVPGPEPLTVDLVALERFQKQFPLITILDVSISPEGQRTRIVDKSLAAAGIELAKPIQIDDRLEKGILDSRFIGDQRVGAQAPGSAPAKDDIEMIFLRGPAIKLDMVFRDFAMRQATDKTVTQLRMDLAQTSKELAIFLKLNDAAAPQAKTIVARAESWKRPGAFRLQFGLMLHSSSLSRLGAISGPSVRAEFVQDDAAQVPEAVAEGAPRRQADVGFAPPDQSAPAADPGNDPNQPSQMLVIVRNLKDRPAP